MINFYNEDIVIYRNIPKTLFLVNEGVSGCTLEVKELNNSTLLNEYEVDVPADFDLFEYELIVTNNLVNKIFVEIKFGNIKLGENTFFVKDICHTDTVLEYINLANGEKKQIKFGFKSENVNTENIINYRKFTTNINDNNFSIINKESYITKQLSDFFIQSDRLKIKELIESYSVIQIFPEVKKVYITNTDFNFIAPRANNEVIINVRYPYNN